MRRHYIDNIRWITVVLVVIYHVFFMYNSIGINIGTLPTSGSHYQDSILYLLYPWFMLILFMIAGISSRLYLEKHTIKEFVKTRTNKLLVPSTLGLFVWCWAQGYVSMKMSALSGSDIAFTGIPAPIMYLILVLSGISVLWFIQLLWVFSMVLALIRKLEKGKLYELCGKTNFPVMMLLVIPLFLSGLILNTPMISVYRFGFYGFGFLLGYFLFAHEEVIDRLRKYRFFLTPAAILLGVAYTVVYYGRNYADPNQELFVINSPLAVAYAWVAVLAIFACAKEGLNKATPFTSFMAKKNFSLYMFHYLSLSAAALLLNSFELPLSVRYVIIFVSCIAGALLLGEIFSRIPVVRYLVMGIKKPKKVQKDKGKEKEPETA